MVPEKFASEENTKYSLKVSVRTGGESKSLWNQQFCGKFSQPLIRFLRTTQDDMFISEKCFDISFQLVRNRYVVILLRTNAFNKPLGFVTRNYSWLVFLNRKRPRFLPSSVLGIIVSNAFYKFLWDVFIQKTKKLVHTVKLLRKRILVKDHTRCI